MSADDIEFAFQCCFCGATIDESVTPAMNLVLGTDDDALQQFYCHSACLKERLHPSVPFLVDDDA